MKSKYQLGALSAIIIVSTVACHSAPRVSSGAINRPATEITNETVPTPPAPAPKVEVAQVTSASVAATDTQTDERPALPVANRSGGANPEPSSNDDTAEKTSPPPRQARQRESVALAGSTSIKSYEVANPMTEFDISAIDQDRLRRIYTTGIKRVFIIVQEGEAMLIEVKENGDRRVTRLNKSAAELGLPEPDQTAGYLVEINFAGYDGKLRFDDQGRLVEMRNRVMRISHIETMNERNIDRPYSNYIVLEDPRREGGKNVALVYALSQHDLDMFACGYYSSFNFRYSEEAGDPNLASDDRNPCRTWDPRVHPNDFAQQRLHEGDGTDIFTFARFSVGMGRGWAMGVYQEPATGKCGFMLRQTDPQRRDEARARLERRGFAAP